MKAQKCRQFSYWGEGKVCLLLSSETPCGQCGWSKQHLLTPFLQLVQFSITVGELSSFRCAGRTDLALQAWLRYNKRRSRFSIQSGRGPKAFEFTWVHRQKTKQNKTTSKTKTKNSDLHSPTILFNEAGLETISKKGVHLSKTSVKLGRCCCLMLSPRWTTLNCAIQATKLI